MSTATAEATDDPTPYLDRKHVDFDVIADADFVDLVFGGRVAFDISLVRSKALSFGLLISGGVMANDKRILVSLPVQARLGIRLGQTLSEFIFKAGIWPAYGVTPASNRLFFLGVAGAELHLRAANLGFILSFDMTLGDAFIPVASVGLSL